MAGDAAVPAQVFRPDDDIEPAGLREIGRDRIAPPGSPVSGSLLARRSDFHAVDEAFVEVVDCTEVQEQFPAAEMFRQRDCPAIFGNSDESFVVRQLEVVEAGDDDRFRLSAVSGLELPAAA